MANSDAKKRKGNGDIPSDEEELMADAESDDVQMQRLMGGFRSSILVEVQKSISDLFPLYTSDPAD